jgi:hypothetical protein
MNNQLVQKYKQAWEEHNIEILREIFHCDVYYQEHIYSVKNGIDELIAYWIENSNKQSNVSFIPIKIIEQSRDIAILWSAKFYDSSKMKEVLLEGMMLMILEDGKIKRFVEYFEHK